jgi:hypothetical protein
MVLSLDNAGFELFCENAGGCGFATLAVTLGDAPAIAPATPQLDAPATPAPVVTPATATSAVIELSTQLQALRDAVKQFAHTHPMQPDPHYLVGNVLTELSIAQHNLNELQRKLPPVKES